MQSCSYVNECNEDGGFASNYSSDLNLELNNNDITFKTEQGLGSKKRKISLCEKLIKTRPIWYLPVIDKNLATYLLNGKSIGHFIITNELQYENTEKSNNQSLVLYTINELYDLEDFKIKIDANNKFKLENSKHAFSQITILIEYYMTNKSEDLSFKLTLPEKLNDATNIKQLNSLSLLEQDFWTRGDFFFKPSLISTTSTKNYNNHNNKSSIRFISTSLKTNPKLPSIDINTSCNNNNNNSKSIKQSSNSISTSDKDTTSSYSSLSYSNQQSQKLNSPHIIKKTCFNKTASYPIRKITSNSINKNNSVELLSIYSTTADNKENIQNKIADYNTNNQTKSKSNSENSNKRNAKSLDDFLWPWKRFHKSDSANSKKKLTNFSETLVAAPTIGATIKSVNKIKIKSANHTEDEEDDVGEEELLNLSSNFNQKSSLNTHLSTNKRTQRFQLFNNNNKISTFFLNLFHKQPTTSRATPSFSSSSASSFTILKTTNNPSSPPIKTLLASTPQQRNLDNSFKIINENGDQVSMNTCITYVNPYIEKKKKTELSSEHPKDQKLLETLSMKKNKQKIPSKNMLITHKENSSTSSSNISVSNTNTSKSLIKYCSRIKNQHDKKINYFKRSASMIEPPKIIQNELNSFNSLNINNNINNNTQKILNYSINEYSEPFDLINDSSSLNTASSSNHENVFVVLKSEPKLPHYFTLSQQSIVTNDDSKNSTSKSTGYSTCSLNKINDTSSDINSLETDCNNKCVMNSDYETVNDCLYKQAIDKNKYSTKVTVYDILNERKPELLKHLRSDSIMKSGTDLEVKEEPPIDTIFLDRVITFHQKSNADSFSSIKSYIYELAQLSGDDTEDNDCIFSKNINEFINCINSSKFETNPYTIMSNIRQFLNGMKNYLIKNSSERFLNLIDAIRQNLNLTQQIFNIDSLIEECLENIVLIKLKHKIYYLLVDWLISNNTLCVFSKNIKELLSINKSLCKKLLGVKDIPEPNILQKIRNYYICMQNEYSPFVKIKYILFIINELLFKFNKFNLALFDISHLNLSEFLPLVIYILCACNMYSMQIEIDYIWGLVYKQSINNEVIFYLTLMSSACHILKTLNLKLLVSNFYLTKNTYACVSDLSYLSNGLFNFLIPNDKSKTIENFYVPIKKSFKCKEICNMIAFMLKIFNSDEYSLYLLDENGFEKKIKDDEQPFDIKNEKFKSNLKAVFIYKHKCANIVWPKTIFFD